MLQCVVTLIFSLVLPPAAGLRPSPAATLLEPDGSAEESPASSMSGEEVEEDGDDRACDVSCQSSDGSQTCCCTVGQKCVIYWSYCECDAA
ncbi:hypothetical protein [Nannocystis pusilla]|uniref:hypothetical protein n=1 Tax=Nannocystis pusilla TaxID=889268 RepID=UPI003BF24CB2